jgi:hypothetical protein
MKTALQMSCDTKFDCFFLNFRDRIVHILAVRPYKKPELFDRMSRGELFFETYLGTVSTLSNNARIHTSIGGRSFF